MILRHHNEDAIAYGWLMICIFLLLGAISWMAVSFAMNETIDLANENIAASKMSAQTRNTMEVARSVAMYMPVFMLIGAFVWTTLRGIGGSGATYQSFYTGWVIFFLCCLIGFYMAFLGGLMIDSLYTELDNQHYIDSTVHMPLEWANAQDATMWWFINAYYFLCCLVSIIGAFVFFQSIVRSTFGNRYIR